ncbi:cysteine hydrolase family protein [Thalassospira australica]|uniref:cysteine hydrolase family protein n=1 Tax=Thalassospira australica TaxID=1528106 RepID=UPI00384A5267
MWLLIGIGTVIILALIAYTIYGHKRHITPSKGQKIDLSQRPNSALLIIDLQEDFTLATGKNAYDPALVDKTISAINELVLIANETGQPVISVRQIFKGLYINLLVKFLNKGRGGPKSAGLDLDARLNGDIDHDITKARADAFSEPELEKVLERQKIGKLQIVGLDGNYCVQSTMQAAINRGYQVSFSDAAILAVNPTVWQKTRARLAARGAKNGDIKATAVAS